MSQKENNLKGDWMRMPMTDFDFIEGQIDKEWIKSTPKEVYTKYINNKVHEGAFKYYMQLKEKSKQKLKNLSYKELSIQPYLTMNKCSLKEKQLLFSLWPHCYKAENFRKMNRGDLKGIVHYFTMSILKECAVNGHHNGAHCPLTVGRNLKENL